MLFIDVVHEASAMLSRDWARPYEDNLREFKDPTTITVHGELPRSICGTYLRNGPGVFYKGDSNSSPRTRVAHPFDGDGAVISIKFDGGEKAEFRARFVQTAECAPWPCHCVC